MPSCPLPITATSLLLHPTTVPADSVYSIYSKSKQNKLELKVRNLSVRSHPDNLPERLGL